MGLSVSAFNWGENAEMTKGGGNPALDSTPPPSPYSHIHGGAQFPGASIHFISAPVPPAVFWRQKV